MRFRRMTLQNCQIDFAFETRAPAPFPREPETHLMLKLLDENYIQPSSSYSPDTWCTPADLATMETSEHNLKFENLSKGLS